MTSSNRHHGSRSRALLGAAVLSAFLVPVGCTAMAAAAPTLIKLASNLLGTASDNYSEHYAEDIKTFLLALSEGQQPPRSSTASPASQAETAASQAETPASQAETAASYAETPATHGGTPASYGATPPKGQLALNVAILQQKIVNGQETAVPIEDGAVLQDGRGNLQAADKVKIAFSTNMECWVYVVAIDGTGWVTPVFPSSESSGTNPVAAERDHTIPEGSRWYALDDNRGVEEIYFVASHERRPDIEEILARFTEHNVRGRDVVRRELLGADAAARTRLRSVEQPALVRRGLVPTGSRAQSTVQTESGSEQEVSLKSFLSQLKGSGVVVTRWFYHQ